MGIVNNSQILTATIPINTAISGVVVLGAFSVLIIEMPAGWDAADMTFQVSSDNSTWRDYYANAAGVLTEYKLTGPAASKAYAMPPADFAAAQYLKVRSGTSASPVNQTAARTINLVARLV
jgi:hypothetical protein